jgi:hypothetical protein
MTQSEPTLDKSGEYSANPGRLEWQRPTLRRLAANEAAANEGGTGEPSSEESS